MKVPAAARASSNDHYSCWGLGTGMSEFLAVLVDGAIYSSWLFVIALGLTLIYGVMKILNMAHGSFYALGAYAAASLVGYWMNHGHAPMASYGMLAIAAV